MEALKFSLKRIEQDVDLEQVDGTILKCKLKELSGLERDRYQSMMAEKIKFGPNGKPAGMKDYKDIEVSLISMSLYGPDGKNLLPPQIGQFPAKVQQALFEAAAALSGLDQKAVDDAKND